MKVIFKKTSEIKDVSFGYAVNFLLPRGLAEIATEEKIKALAKAKAKENLQAKARKKEDEALAQKLKGKTLTLKVKTGKAKKLFGSITKKEILQALNVDPKRVEVILEKPIKKLGSYQIELKIGSNRIKIKLNLKKE